MTPQDIDKLVENNFLSVFGAVHCNRDDGVRTIVLLGPREPGFWVYFTTSDEYRDGEPNPLDRWSKRVISNLSNRLNAKDFYPFGGPSYEPFIQWAKDSGRAHVSPVGLLVHDVAGLMVSYRGALGFSERLEIAKNPPSPCLSCENRPCRTACPVNALELDFYDVPRCKTDLENPKNDCMSTGCAVRRACPVSQKYGRVETQSAFHMRAFK